MGGDGDIHILDLWGCNTARILSVTHPPLAVVLNGSVWATGGEEDLAVGPFDGVLEVEFAHGQGVGEREDDGTFVEFGHSLDDFPGEGALKRPNVVSD